MKPAWDKLMGEYEGRRGTQQERDSVRPRSRRSQGSSSFSFGQDIVVLSLANIKGVRSSTINQNDLENEGRQRGVRTIVGVGNIVLRSAHHADRPGHLLSSRRQ